MLLVLLLLTVTFQVKVKFYAFLVAILNFVGQFK